MEKSFFSSNSLSDLKTKLTGGDRVALGRAITLAESKKKEDRKRFERLLNDVLPSTGKSFRIGITGVPGVGKSTFIDTFGTYLISKNHKVAVLSVDPSSSRSKGSILGDKTRMESLSHNPEAFIRPSPAGDVLGGVALATREAMLLCEAAGFDIIIIETVGVGQSETAIEGFVDFFMLLMLAGSGDELQGIKRGIMEVADMLVINKSDINPEEIKRAQLEFGKALHLFPRREDEWDVPIIKVSSTKKEGVADVWSHIEAYQKLSQSTHSFEKKRSQQELSWFRQSLTRLIENEFFEKGDTRALVASLEKQILQKQLSPTQAMEQVIAQRRNR